MQLQETFAQEPASAKSTDKPQKDSENDAPPKEKPVLRRNEASGTVALVTLQDARAKLLTYRTVRAKVTEVVSLGDRQFRMEGSYLQGTDLKVRVEYKVQVGGTEGRLLEVCDGRLLWTHQQVGKEQRVSRRDVRQILDAAATPDRSPDDMLQAELGLGGLGGLLASIQSSVQFEKQWEQDFDGVPFVVIDGTWRVEQRQKFLGPNATADDALPALVPDRIRVYFQKDVLFPRRIMYLKRPGKGKAPRPMLSIDFTDVAWNIDVGDEAFKFERPENVDPQDVTEGYLKQFGKGKANSKTETR